MLIVVLMIVVVLLTAMREIAQLNKNFNQVQQSREHWMDAYIEMKTIMNEFFEEYEAVGE